MQKDMDIEQSDDSRRARLQQKIERYMARMEGIIEELLVGVEISELSSRDRLFAVARFIDLYQHAILVDNTLEENRIENRESNAISAVLRRMKAEKERENYRVVDVEIIPYREIGDSDLEDV